MNLLYIAAQIPWGKGEAFVLEEMIEVKKQGISLLTIPRNPPKEIFHKRAESIINNAIWLPLINIEMIIVFFRTLFLQKKLWSLIKLLTRYYYNPKVFFKNLSVLPKGTYIASIITKFNIDHIHAHWGSTTSTIAWVASELTGIPWSATLHRWDINETNLLRDKLKSAKFFRCISKNGKEKLLNIVGAEFEAKTTVIHMGVTIPFEKREIPTTNKDCFQIVTPANLLPVKGHQYLIEACSELVQSGISNFNCFFFGEGFMEHKLREMIEEKRMENHIKIFKMVPNEDLIKMYRKGQVSLVILPSINTNDKQHEGIPVALMEAMAYSIPVISTNTGSIVELLDLGAGILVEEKNSIMLAENIRKLIQNESIRKEIGKKGYDKVSKGFNIKNNTKILINLFKSCQ